MIRTRKGREQRKYPRIEANIRVEFKTAEKLAVEYTKNISRGGVFLKTDRLIDPNAEVELILAFPEGLGEHKIRGRVTRLMSMTDPVNAGKQIHGVGIRFLNPAEDLLAAIERILSAAGIETPVPSAG